MTSWRSRRAAQREASTDQGDWPPGSSRNLGAEAGLPRLRVHLEGGEAGACGLERPLLGAGDLGHNAAGLDARQQVARGCVRRIATTLGDLSRSGWPLLLLSKAFYHFFTAPSTVLEERARLEREPGPEGELYRLLADARIQAVPSAQHQRVRVTALEATATGSLARAVAALALAELQHGDEDRPSCQQRKKATEASCSRDCAVSATVRTLEAGATEGFSAKAGVNIGPYKPKPGARPDRKNGFGSHAQLRRAQIERLNFGMVLAPSLRYQLQLIGDVEYSPSCQPFYTRGRLRRLTAAAMGNSCCDGVNEAETEFVKAAQESPGGCNHRSCLEVAECCPSGRLDTVLNYPDCFRVLQPPEKLEHQRLFRKQCSRSLRWRFRGFFLLVHNAVFLGSLLVGLMFPAH
eukprot:s1433_g1.t1